MTEQPKFHELHRIATFAAALSAATDRINVLSAKLAILADTSGVAALRIADLSSNTTRLLAQSQAMRTACQYKCSGKPQSDQPLSLLAKALSVMFVGGAFVATAKLWRDIIGWLLKTSIGRAVASRAVSGVGVARGVLQAVIGSEFVASIAAGVSGVAAGRAIPEVAFTIAAIVTGTAVGVGASHLLWRDWGAIVRTIRNVGSALSAEAATIIRKVASVVDGQSEPYSNEQSDPDTDGPTGRKRARHRYGFASSRWSSLVAAALRFPASVFMTLAKPEISSSGPRALTIPLGRTATALLAFHCC